MGQSDDLKFEYRHGCLIVRASGSYPIEHKEAAVRAIGEAMLARPIKAAIIDGRKVDGPFSFMDRYQLGELAGLHLKHAPVAVLARAEQTDKQLIGKLVATNRGAKLEVFTVVADAEAWLRRHTPVESQAEVSL